MKKIERKGKDRLMLQNIYVDPQVSRVTKAEIRDLKTKKSMFIDYADFKNFGSTYMAKKLAMKFKANKELTIELTHEKFDLDKEGLSFPFKVPSKFEPLKVQ